MNYQAKLEWFETLATDSERLGKLAAYGSNRELYSRLALHYRDLADDMRKLIATENAA